MEEDDMKRYFTIMLLSVLVFGLSAAEMAYTPQKAVTTKSIALQSGQSFELKTDNINKATRTRAETVFYFEDFEDGWNGWETEDGTIPVDQWHLSDAEPYTGNGYSWWMADPEIGGYRNNRYNVLDTPAILVTEGNSALSFKLAYAFESPAVHEGYDGWDGANIRISTDNGETWSILEGLPAYNCRNMWSFGEIHGEGRGIPGWGGKSDGWVDATYNLSEYVGQEVIIRFAFASDLGLDSTTEPELFGMKIDEITLGDFFQDFDDGEEHGMVYKSLLPVGGDLWHIGVPTETPPSPVNAALCQNEEGTYNGGMLNYIISPPITLPPSGDIRADFMLRGDFHGDDAAFPNCDYWGWEISPNNGRDWYAMSNPYGKDGGKNYVYIDAPAAWYSVASAYSLDGDISGYAGETVRFRIYMYSIQHQPSLEGIMIDDYVIYHSQYLPAPTNLMAHAVDQEVDLSWDIPASGGSEGWINWDNGANHDGVGTEQAGITEVSARFTAADLNSYVGGSITRIKFFPRELNAKYKVKVWRGITGSSEVTSQVVNTFTPDAWNEVVLNDPVNIEFGVDYWIGYEADALLAGQFPLGIDSGPRVQNKGDMIKLGGAWQSLFDATGGQLDGNWNIQALVEIQGIPSILSNNRALTGFNIYRSATSGNGYNLIENVDQDTDFYIDANPITGANNFYVISAIYDDGESEFSNEASVFVMSPTAYEHYYDDGTAETGYNAGHNNHVAVRFIPEINGEAHLSHIKVYVETKKSGGMVLKIYPDVDGSPAPMQINQFIYAAGNIKTGWNTITVQPDNPIYLTSSPFYIAIQETNASSAVGLDQDTVSSSLTQIGKDAPWNKLQAGNLMIRAILDGNTDVETVLTPAPQRLTVNNYPNPFNPETTIKMSIPKATDINLSVYNLKGQLVKTIVDDFLTAGDHSYVWDGKDQNGTNVSSGIYFYKVESDSQTINKRMILLK